MQDQASNERLPPVPASGRRRCFFWFVTTGGVLTTALLVWNAVANDPYPKPIGIALSLLIGVSLTCAVGWAARGFR